MMKEAKTSPGGSRELLFSGAIVYREPRKGVESGREKRYGLETRRRAAAADYFVTKPLLRSLITN